MLATRTWARGVVTSYQYNLAGDLVGTTYSDGSPAISRTLRRDGQRSSEVDSAGTHAFEYSNPGAGFSRETISGGMLDGLEWTVLNGAVNGQRTAFSASRSGQSLDYGYDARSRPAGVTSAESTFTYVYAANSNQIASVTSSYQGNQVLQGQRVYDNNNRLDSISYSVGANVLSLHDYQYDLIHRRTRADREDGAYWLYGYNDRNEVTSARKFAADNSGLAGWGSDFAFDAIGNRLWADRGGDSAGANMRRTSYTPNSLNQYTSVSNPGGFDVLGQAVATASITVNTVAAERKGDLFRKEITVDNSSGIVRQAVNTTATLTGAGLNGADVIVQRNGNKVVRPASETITHDLDGNLLSDSLWNYSWNGENRLIAVETSATAISAGVSKRKWGFDYDAQGRKIRKTDYSWDGSAWVLDQERLCVYDGWNLIAELDGATGDLVQRYTWGLDVSGTMQGAGGVGGLLSMEDFSGLPIPLYYTYDGNGNVMAVVRATDGEVVAEYEYSAFGELLRAEGELSDINPWRHATKYQDESGLLYYGFRYYSAESGRWLSRDPIGERGGRNLYGFVGNDGVNRADVLGLASKGPPIIIGFKGFNDWRSAPNGGNRRMDDIRAAVGGEPLFSSKSDQRAFNYLLRKLDNVTDGKYDSKDTERDIKIFGWSWGGITAIKLARKIKDSKKFSICRKTVKVIAVIDPDTFGYFTNSNVPDNVKAFYNWYQSNGTGGLPHNSKGNTLGIDDSGETASNFQIDYNSTGDRETFKYPKLVPAIISHHTIIWEVYSDVVASLR